MEEIRKGYKQTEVGIIPEDWEVKNLESLCDFVNGKAHEAFVDELGQYLVANSKFISTDGQVKKYSSVNICPALKDDILIVMSDVPNGRAIGKCYFVTQNDIITINQRVGAIRNSIVFAKYLWFIR